MSNRTKGALLKGSSLLLSVGVPFAATCTQFPMWIEKSATATVSGLFVIFALISSIPLFRWLKRQNKSPSGEIIWTLVFIMLIAVNEIIKQMILISFFGMLANWIGAILYNFGEKLSEREEKDAGVGDEGD